MRLLISIAVGVFFSTSFYSTVKYNQCHEATLAGHQMEQFDDQVAYLFYECNQTKGNHAQCQLLPELAKESLQNHETFQQEASRCLVLPSMPKTTSKPVDSSVALGMMASR